MYNSLSSFNISELYDKISIIKKLDQYPSLLQSYYRFACILLQFPMYYRLSDKFKSEIYDIKLRMIIDDVWNMFT